VNISQQFAPPFKLISPFFILGISIYLLSMVGLFGIDVANISIHDGYTLSWVHLYLLGFVMMIILGASAQLVPVVLEKGHFAVDLYYAIYPLLLVGTTLMVVGFYIAPVALPFGGLLVLVAFAIFIGETILTIAKVEKLNFIISSVLIANIFLFFGLGIGIVMAIGYSGLVSVDIISLLKAHIYMVFVGYVGITIMGLSLILLPMFWLSHSFSWIWVKTAVGVLSLTLLLVGISVFVEIRYIDIVAYSFAILAFLLYFWQIFIIYQTRVRKDKDIYFKAMLFSFSSLYVSLVLLTYNFFSPSHNLYLATFALIFLGFVGFLISGHLYKIVPFLVWYERFSPHVGKRKVPMLADMVPEKTADIQFLSSSIGVVLVVIGIATAIDTVYMAGVISLIVGAVLLLRDLFYMMNFDEKNITDF